MPEQRPSDLAGGSKPTDFRFLSGFALRYKIGSTRNLSVSHV